MTKLIYRLSFIVNRLSLKSAIQYTKSRLGVTINQSGQILLLSLVALGVVVFTVLSIVAGAQLYYQNSSYSLDAEKATALAEAGVDKALVSLNKTGGSYNGETETVFGDGSYSVTITSTDAATKVIQVTGYVPGKAQARAKRTVKITSSRGVGVSFVYGVQVGDGGLEMGNSNVITGSVYSNGSVEAGNDNSISGDVWVAGGPQASPDQQFDCTNCGDFIFGRIWNGNSQFDVGMSFQPSAEADLNKVSLKLKKFGNPPDATVRIMSDSGGKPYKNGVLATGTLYSSLVTNSYGWIDVTFDHMPELEGNTAYWIVVDTSNDLANYWAWQSDSPGGYSRGSPKWSPDWSVGNPTWNSFNPASDLSFKVFMGGGVTSVSGGNNFTVGGSVHANTINGVIIAKDAFYQVLTNSSVGGTKNPNSADPPPKVFPISDANVTAWKDDAAAPGGTNTRGPITSCISTLGPIKVVGDVTFNSNCTVVIKSPVWITGNLTLNSNNIIRLDPSFGASSGVIVVDGKTILGSNNKLEGTGTDSSLLMLLSTYDSQINNDKAIEITNTGNSGVFYASKGAIEPGNHNSFKELTAWKIEMINNSTINYETGLSSTMFSSGPSGSYSLVKGTYQVK